MIVLKAKEPPILIFSNETWKALRGCLPNEANEAETHALAGTLEGQLKYCLNTKWLRKVIDFLYLSGGYVRQ